MADQKYPQDEEKNEYRYISPSWLDEIARGLTAGAEKHPGETWRTIPSDEHLSRAMRHINLYRMGDRTEPHIINASMRLMMAFCTTRNEEVMDALGLSYERGSGMLNFWDFMAIAAVSVFGWLIVDSVANAIRDIYTSRRD